MEASPGNPDYLTELIPYRCPKCGDLRRFATLRELKRHLEGDHYFKMGCIRPRKRLRVFTQDAEDKNHLMDNPISSPTSGERYSEDSARMSPLLHSYKEEAKMLEMQVEFAKQEELKNKLSGIKSKAKDNVSSSPSGSGTDSKTDPSIDRIGDDNSTSFVNHEKTFTNVPSSLSKNDFNKIPPLKSGYSEFRNVLDSLNQEVIRSRERQWKSAESLHKAEDILLGMEKAAEEKCEEQRRIIQKLLKGLNDKEDTLRSASNELDTLQLQRQRLLKETEDIFYKADEKNRILRHELEHKERQMSCLNRELEKLKFYSQTELRQKDEELKNANKEAKRLEWEREHLTREAEELLKRADLNSEGLRKTNERKEEQLRYVNKELDKLRWEQQDLLEQSIELYKKADEGTNILKGMLKAKDQQLNEALEGLKHMHEVQARLLEESRWLTQQADENSDSMKKLLIKKEEQFRLAKHELEKLRDDEKNLRESSASFASKAESNSAIIENLQELVQRKEEELCKTKTELSSLKKFISQTAEKERVARAKLEKFIGELIDRADKAEKETRTLTRTSDKNSSRSQSYIHTNEDDTVNEHVKTSRSPGNGTQSIWTRKLAEDIATGKHIQESMSAKHIQDSLTRRNRDSKQHPQKPCIKGKINPLGHQIVDLGMDSWFENYPGFSLRPAVNPVPDQLEESPGLLITQVVQTNNSDRIAMDSAQPEETNYSFGVSKHVHDGGNNTETVNMQNVQMYGNISSPPSWVQSHGDLQDKNSHFKVGAQFVSHKHVNNSQINANNSYTQTGFQFPDDPHEDASRAQYGMYIYANKNAQHNRLNGPLQLKASSDSQHYATRQEKEIMFRQGGELAMRGNQPIVQSDVFEYPYATKPKLERHGGELVHTKKQLLLPHFVGSDRLINQMSVTEQEEAHYPIETDESDDISNRGYETCGMEHFEFQPNVYKQRSKAMIEPGGFDNPPEQVPVMLQQHHKVGQHQARAVRNETYGQEAPLGININISRHRDSDTQEHNSYILSPPKSFRDYSSMPCGLNDPKYFRNEDDYDDINFQIEPDHDEIGKYQPFSHVTKQHCVPSVKLERLHRFSKSEADLPRHLKTLPGRAHADLGYLNKKLGSKKATPHKGFHLSQPAKTNLRRHLRILPGPINIEPGGHLSRKSDTSLKKYMLPQLDDSILPDRPSSNYRRRTQSQSPTARRRDRRSVDPDRSYEDHRVEDSYTYFGDIIPPRNLKKLSVAHMPIVRPTCRSHDNDEEKQVDTVGYVNNGNFEQIIDENGIMWEDNQDTLPDISDSELDRISPSGTEAVSGNMANSPISPKYREDESVSSRQSLQSRQNQTAFSKKGNIPNSGAMERSNHSNRQVSNVRTDVHSDVNMSRETSENPPEKNKHISSANEKIPNSDFVQSNCDNGRRMSGKYTTGSSLSASDLHSRERYSSKSSSSNSNSFLKSQSPLDSRSKYLSGEEESKRSKLFQPIKSPIAKSGSDQDLTSGGREVHATLILRENNTKCITPDSMLSEKFNETNEERSTDGTLSYNSEYTRKSPISDIPELLTEENHSVKSDCETSFRNIEQKSARLGPNTEEFIRGSPSVKAFKDKLDAIAQKYSVKSRCIKIPEAKLEQSSSCQDKVNAVAQKYSLKSIISNPAGKSDFRRQSSPERATSPVKSQNHSLFSSSGGNSSPEKRYGSGKQPDMVESSKYDMHLDNENRSSSFDRQYNLDRKPREISQISCDKLPGENGEISEGRHASYQNNFFSGVERQSCDETHVDQDRKFSNDIFSVLDGRLTPNKTSLGRHESFDGNMNAEGRNNSTFSDISSSKRTILRKSPLPYSSSDEVDEKLEEAEYTDDWEMDNVWRDASQHSKAFKSPSSENLDETDKSSIMHEHGSRDKKRNGQEDKVKQIESVHGRDVSYEFNDMPQKEEMVKKMCKPDARNDRSSVLNPDDSAKDTFIKHDAGSTMEIVRNELRSDHSIDAPELYDNDNIEDLRHSSRESNMNFKDAARPVSLSDGETIKQHINAITTMADIHQEDLYDSEEYVPEMDDLPESAQALSDLQQPGSMFAVPMIESSSVDGDSNKQYFIDQNNLTETELDTDADSRRISQDFSSGSDKDGFKIRVKRKVYSKSRFKRQTARKHVLSPSSSQG
ncbi:hypothetical protein CHS0354_006130 [Potamilus streckersoni]|uniref:FBX41/ZN365 C2H2-type zinc finger domain-containing protein n=1 Tax=Potamilus streckersoni TaxID=2493646 RepID=A0AAE0ST67_9BIVA|nr:hypothetical protein CHS0354_006130 [Potamilus streckersoni]